MIIWYLHSPNCKSLHVSKPSQRRASDSVTFFQCFQIPLSLRMFHVRDFVVRILAQKDILDMGWVLSTLSCQYICNKYINKIHTGSTSKMKGFLNHISIVRSITLSSCLKMSDKLYHRFSSHLSYVQKCVLLY